MTAQEIDDVLAGTFPASDPPAWTPGMARPAPADREPHVDAARAQDDKADARTDAHRSVALSDGERTLWRSSGDDFQAAALAAVGFELKRPVSS